MCTERKATGEYVLACFMFATMMVTLSMTKVFRKIPSSTNSPTPRLLAYATGRVK